jgi:hypothetical protein
LKVQTSANTFATELAALFRRDLTRLAQELRAFPDTASLWKVAPGVSNAAGTLALHLEGNLRELIGRQLGRVEYQRDRPLEFAARGLEQAEIARRIDAVCETIPPIVGAIEPEFLDLDYPEPYDGQPRSTRQFLMHLATHLNYHLGQIDYLRRVVTGDGPLPLARL